MAESVVIIHAVIAGIASLILQLLAEDDIRPASEVRWDPMRTWTAPVREKNVPVKRETPDADWSNVTAPDRPPDTNAEAGTPETNDKVSWKAASEAAWLGHAPDTDHDGSAQDSTPSAPDSDPGSPREHHNR